MLDDFLKKLSLLEKKDDGINVPAAQTSTTTRSETQKDQHQYISNYSKINTKSATSINHKNLTTLTYRIQ